MDFKSKIEGAIVWYSSCLLALDSYKLSLKSIKDVVDVLNNRHSEVFILSLDSCWIDDRYVEELLKLKNIWVIHFGDNLISEKGIEMLFNSKICDVYTEFQIDKDYGKKIGRCERRTANEVKKKEKKNCVIF